MKLQIKINNEEKKKILNARQFNHSIYYKLDYLVDGKLVAQSFDFLYEYLENFKDVLNLINEQGHALLKCKAGVVDIDITRKSNSNYHLRIISDEKATQEEFAFDLSYDEFKKTYLILLKELEELALKLDVNISFDDFKKV